MSATKTTTRQVILEAAYTLIRSEGVNKLTLDGVAQQAQVSKGGLLYHFPTKNDLIKGMIDYFFSQYQDDLHRDVSDDNEPHGKWARAYVRTTFTSEEQELQVSAGLIAALVNNPELLKPVQDYYSDWQQRMENDGIDPAIATICRLAADGMWYADLFGLAPLENGELRQRVQDTLLRLTKGGYP